VSFWCSAQDVAWSWQWRAYPGVWLFVLLVGFAVWRWNRAGARAAGRPAPPLRPGFVIGLFLLWAALDWPIGALGAGYLASVHMLQFLILGLGAPPLLLRGLSPDALALIERDAAAARLVRRLTAPLAALVLFNVVVLITHLPAVVDALMPTQWGSLLIDVAWIAAGLAFWWPVVIPVPRHARFVPPVRIGYLAVGIMFSPVMFGLVAFLVYSQTPLYGIFELAPPLPGVNAHADHQTAGVLMSVGGATIAFVAISVIFFRWSRESA
jgi:putative membrane protein